MNADIWSHGEPGLCRHAGAKVARTRGVLLCHHSTNREPCNTNWSVLGQCARLQGLNADGQQESGDLLDIRMVAWYTCWAGSISDAPILPPPRRYNTSTCCVSSEQRVSQPRTVTWKPASSPPMTWSMMPYRLASSGDMYLSRSVSSSICASPTLNVASRVNWSRHQGRAQGAYLSEELALTKIGSLCQHMDASAHG